MKPYNIYVTVAYPPDTDTPGFAEENKSKVGYCDCERPLCINRPVSHIVGCTFPSFLC
uniref:Uncharacterized protein n=1 Tax=Anguilla anguilla TaxID=7936 RepID=A0A0E9WIJ5_ANGAN